MGTLLRYFLVVAFALFIATTNVNGQAGVPRFSDYPVTERFHRKTAPLVLRGAARMYRTRLREAAREKPNFAGHSIVATWGCGTECVAGAIIDARTGRVFMLPFTLCCWNPGIGADKNFKPVDFRPDSGLLVLSGARNEQDGDSVARFYRFKNNRLVLLKAIPR